MGMMKELMEKGLIVKSQDQLVSSPSLHSIEKSKEDQAKVIRELVHAEF